jgi:hypothetical protein
MSSILRFLNNRGTDYLCPGYDAWLQPRSMIAMVPQLQHTSRAIVHNEFWQGNDNLEIFQMYQRNSHEGGHLCLLDPTDRRIQPISRVLHT